MHSAPYVCPVHPACIANAQAGPPGPPALATCAMQQSRRRMAGGYVKGLHWLQTAAVAERRLILRPFWAIPIQCSSVQGPRSAVVAPFE